MDTPLDYDPLVQLLDTIDVPFTDHEHPPVFTVDVSKARRGELP